MSSDLARRYEALPYCFGPFLATHPARIGAIARLLRHPSVGAYTAKVIELGCGPGINILPLAASLPRATFVGVDICRPYIEDARRLAQAAGLTNITFVCADLCNLPAAEEKYDYIVAHGVFSWVDDQTKEALLIKTRDMLSTDGVAYISYNTYPGWKQREVLRDIVLMLTRDVPDGKPRLEAAAQVLSCLRQAVSGGSGPYSAFLSQVLEFTCRKLGSDLGNGAGLFHDDLAPIMDPCYFAQFAALAQQSGLAYLGDADFPTIFRERHPERVRSLLEQLKLGQVEGEQLLDVMTNRSFRMSLLVHAGRQRENTLNRDAIQTFSFGAGNKLNSSSPAAAEWDSSGSGGERYNIYKHACLKVLGEAWPRRIDFSDLLRDMKALCATQHTEFNDRAVADILIGLCCSGQVDFMLADDRRREIPSADPIVHPLVREMVQKGLPATSQWHERIALNELQRSCLLRLDGQHRFEALDEKDAVRYILNSGVIAVARN